MFSSMGVMYLFYSVLKTVKLKDISINKKADMLEGMVKCGFGIVTIGGIMDMMMMLLMVICGCL